MTSVGSQACSVLRGGPAICHTGLCPGGPVPNVGQSAGGIVEIQFYCLNSILGLGTRCLVGGMTKPSSQSVCLSSADTLSTIVSHKTPAGLKRKSLRFKKKKSKTEIRKQMKENQQLTFWKQRLLKAQKQLNFDPDNGMGLS